MYAKRLEVLFRDVSAIVRPQCSLVLDSTDSQSDTEQLRAIVKLSL